MNKWKSVKKIIDTNSRDFDALLNNSYEHFYYEICKSVCVFLIHEAKIYYKMWILKFLI